MSAANPILDLFKSAWGISKAGTIGAAAGAGVVGGGLLAAGMSYSAATKATGYAGYKWAGHAMNFGMEPVAVLDHTHGEWAGATRMKGWGHFFDVHPNGNFRGPTHQWPMMQTPEAAAFNGKGISMARIKAHMPGTSPFTLLGLAGNAYFAYQGYQEGGIWGAYDSIALSAATEASLHRWGYGVGLAQKGGAHSPMQPWTKVAGSNLGLTAGIRRGLGAGIGGYIGQSLGLATGIPMAGTIGATAGAYIGGAPLQAMRANPLLVGGAMAVVTGAAISYGAYTVLKEAGQAGYNHRQNMRGVNTDGTMAAFMTQNATTMRARAVQAISKSHLNARSALGQEANFMHSPKNYNSNYR